MSNLSDFISSGGGGGINEVEIKPDEFNFDDTDTGVDGGTAFDIYDTADFNADNDGSIWFGFKFPDGWDDTKDIKFTVQHNLNGVDDSKIVKLDLKCWTIANGETPSNVSPDDSGSDNITSATANMGKHNETVLTNGKVSNANLSSTTKRIACKLTRDADDSGDTYTGTFQVMAIRAYQD